MVMTPPTPCTLTLPFSILMSAPAWMRPALTSSTYLRNASLLSSSDGM